MVICISMYLYICVFILFAYLAFVLVVVCVCVIFLVPTFPMLVIENELFEFRVQCNLL